MTKETFFRISGPEVSAEDFKSEILAIDLKSGCYHSLRHSGAYIWRLLMEGHSIEASLPWLSAFYGLEVLALEPEVRAFVSELEAQKLIVGAASPTEVPALPLPEISSEGYTKPLVETYSDLQDLLLLDPIHEVDMAGWPHKRTDAM